ncbi:glycosyltransferase family 1 protein [Lysinibacillus yapensis]|uniref:Glycosyltransferase family 1 protein n=1 Tax=Ureibacillus yapensis TaxID=2304605 RepID=A0A396SSX0_9BACL|nr:glycosyltransferase family 4 protein [Lysinibacillus yapensis]RHW39561.1 glycosyltransferase family 1 protein [Lysinibacillus yapensis]
MKKIVILSNHHSYTYNFRKEIIQALIDKGFKVWVVMPYGEKVELLEEMGCIFIDVPLDRRGKNPIKDMKLITQYFKIIKDIKPDMVLTYTIKPNLYGGLICRVLGIPYIANITGLSSAIEGKKIMENLIALIYKIAFKKITCVFCQNSENYDYFANNKIVTDKLRLIPGSGVNINHFSLLDYPTSNNINFVFISRIMKEKGIDQFLDAAQFIKKEHPSTNFHILGFCEESYEEKLNEMEKNGVIKYHGMQDDVRKFHEISHCTIHPTYYPEGISNVLLESAASGRPIITTNRSGCREIVENGINGYVVEQQNSEDLIKRIEEFLQLDFEVKKQMGIAGRRKVEQEFDRQIVVNAYIGEIEKQIVGEYSEL